MGAAVAPLELGILTIKMETGLLTGDAVAIGGITTQDTDGEGATLGELLSVVVKTAPEATRRDSEWRSPISYAYSYTRRQKENRIAASL